MPFNTPLFHKVVTGCCIAAVAVLGGCASPLHLTYDHGRAFTEAFTSQPDLTRPSVASSTYHLYGTEAAEIRIRVREETTDKEDGTSKLQN
ncbi:MAG: hypothetical protein H6736_07585 [Alphaproteobacteria bacterium]|nr:hypothetical protein [Alphaproteobacteria bacterium]MCB9691661.1 hypothetical protein [Alphaproteobacteria bacterium]